MLLASAVIRRSGATATAFSERWRALADANPHVREQYTLAIALQEAPAHAVAVVEPHAAKRLEYPAPQNLTLVSG